MSVEYISIASLVLLATAVLIMPIVRYLFIGWVAKRNDIMDGQSQVARTAYFAMFCRYSNEQRASAEKSAENTRSQANTDLRSMPIKLAENNRGDSPNAKTLHDASEFACMYERFYGRRLFYAPTALLILVFGVLATMALSFPIIPLPTTTLLGFRSLDPIGRAAVSGAFMWVVNDFIWRSRRLDFSPADIHWSVLRFAICVPMAYCVVSVLPTSPPIGVFIAFALGAFPLADIMTILRRLATSRLGFAPSAQESADDIVKLQGINRDILERLANEDIATITQLAYCDPIRLAMRSNLSFNFITDCMNQALAWVYLEDKMKDLRVLGLKGAVEIKHLLTKLDSSSEEEKKIAQQTFDAAAAKVGLTGDTLKNAFHEIATDSFTDYLFAVWN